MKKHQWGRTFSVKCPRCGAPRGQWCVVLGTNQRTDPPHSLRVDKAAKLR